MATNSIFFYRTLEKVPREGLNSILFSVTLKKRGQNRGPTHWGRVTHICVGNLTIIGPDNGLSPGRRQAITWTNAGILLIGPLGTNWKFNRNSNIFIHENAIESVVCEMAAILSWPVLIWSNWVIMAKICWKCTQAIGPQPLYENQPQNTALPVEIDLKKLA